MIAVVTTVSGRHDHLRLHLAGIDATGTADLHVVVAMDDPDVAAICSEHAGRTGREVIGVDGHPGGLPVAAARNAGARRAIETGADLLVFLDVDCVPGPALIPGYRVAALGDGRDALLSGPVVYLPPPPPGGYRLRDLPLDADPHPARPMPDPGRLQQLDHRLFWSLSFAVTAAAWSRIGGFHEGYVGYGAEDTDFGQLARSRGVDHFAVGGATAFHQWHPSAQPPLHHLDDIVRNGRIFRERWGWWPMQGWLAEFRGLGLVEHDAATDDWRRSSDRPSVT